MVSTADLLLIFEAQDNVSHVAQQIQNNVGQMGTGINQSTGGIRGTMRELGGIFQGLNGLVMGVFGTYGLSTFKNMTYGTATAREQIKQLWDTTAGTTAEAGALWGKMDDLTNHGYVSLDQLATAMNILGMSAGADVEQMDTMVNLINEIGNRAILMGYDANRTQLLMNSVATGLNGRMDMLNNAFGITKEKLTNLGWKGTTDDVEGYTEALKSYLKIGNEAGDHLDNTQGKVISLQKRFRIAGRNLGMYMLPPINAVMDAFTQLNEQSNDLLASLIIVGTGAMSGFASILPTLSPILQLYDFMEKKLVDVNGESRVMNTLLGKSGGIFGGLRKVITTLFSPITRVTRGFYDWIAYPVFNFVHLHLRTMATELWRIAKIPAGAVFDAMGTSYSNFLKRESIVNVKNKVGGAKDTIKKGIGTGVEKVMVPYSGFINTYGSEITQIKARSKAYEKYKQLVEAGKISLDTELATTLKMLDARDAEILKTRILQKATKDGIDAEVLSAAMTKYGTGIVEWDTIANELNAASTDTQTASKERGVIATKLHTAWTWIHSKATGALTKAFNILTGAEALSMWWILLIIGAIVGLILVIDQIGKTLGWWDNWKKMLEAIVAGLNRLWQAFINNPNVQAFIKDLQWIFGQLGGAISEVAWQVLQFFGWKDDGSEVDIVRMIIDAFGALADILGKVVNAIKWVESTFHIFGTIYTIVSAIVGSIIGVLRGIICILLGCSPGIVPALEKVGMVFSTIFGGIASFLSNPVGFIVNQFKNVIKGAEELGDMIGGFLVKRINQFLDFLGPLGTVIRQIFANSLGIVANIIRSIANFIGRIFNIFGGMLSGKISVEEGLNQLSRLIVPILTRIWNIFVGIFTRIRNFVIQSAKNMVGGFINYILTIPRRLLSIFNQLIGNLFNIPQKIFGAGQKLGQDIYAGLDSGVNWLTGGLVHLPGMEGNPGQTKSNAKTMRNANKNYSNNTNQTQGNIVNIYEGAIQLDARNLTTKESQQVMINALEGLGALVPVMTKGTLQQATGGGNKKNAK